MVLVGIEVLAEVSSCPPRAERPLKEAIAARFDRVMRGVFALFKSNRSLLSQRCDVVICNLAKRVTPTAVYTALAQVILDDGERSGVLLRVLHPSTTASITPEYCC